MIYVYLVLWILAFLCFCISVFGSLRVNFVALGLALGALVFVLQTLDVVM